MNLKETVLSSLQETSPIKGSIKRFLALGCMLMLAYVVVMDTTPENAVSIATILSTLIASLVGIGAYQVVSLAKKTRESRETTK